MYDSLTLNDNYKEKKIIYLSNKISTLKIVV